MARKNEAGFQDKLIKLFETVLFPGSIVMKNDSAYRQGFPDLTIYLPDGFAIFLEVKKSDDEPYQPNQEYYLMHCKERLGYFTATIYPENMEEVINEIQQAYEIRRKTCTP